MPNLTEKPQHPHLWHRAFRWLAILFITFCLFLLALAGMQRKLMYFPERDPFEPAQWAMPELKLLPVASTDNLTLRSFYLPPKNPQKLTIVFFQGNAGHLGYRNYKFRPWIEAGCGVLLVGYRGFSNPGDPTEKNLYADARATLNTLLEKGGQINKTVFYGESLGTGVATQMATEFRAAGLILESPYTSVPDVAQDRYPFVPVHSILQDKFDSLAKIARIQMPLLLLHGEKDHVIPVKFGKKLFAEARPPKEALYVPEADHNNVYTPAIQNEILHFLDNCNGISLNQTIERTIQDPDMKN